MNKTKHYLARVLPKRRYKKIDDLHDYDKFFLCRLTNKDRPVVKKSNAYPDFIVPKDFLGGLSVNLLSVFTHLSAQYRPQGKIKEPHFEEWNRGEDAALPSRISFIPKANFLGIKIADLKTIETCALIITTIKTEGNKQVKVSQNVEGYLKAVHNPTKCNFWHCEVQVWGKSDSGNEFCIEENETISKTGRRRYVDQIASALTPTLLTKLRHSSECKRHRLPKEIYS